MYFATDLATVTHGIQLAVAPVFLLTAVAGMIGSVAGRLARIIDRARVVEARLALTDGGSADDAVQARAAAADWQELAQLRLRGRLVNACIALLTLCAMCIGLTIVSLFLGETTALQMYRAATGLFLGGVSLFLLALLCFLTETLIATRMLRFGHRPFH